MIYVLWPVKRRVAGLAGLLFIMLIALLGASGDERKPSKSIDELIGTSARQHAILSKVHRDSSVKTYHWVTGIGARNARRLSKSERFRAERPRLRFSNMYLTILLDQGAIGLMCFLLSSSRPAILTCEFIFTQRFGSAQDLRQP